MNKENRKQTTHLNRNIEENDLYINVSVINRQLVFFSQCFYITDPGCYDLTKQKMNKATTGTTQPSHNASTTVPNKNMSSHLERYIFTGLWYK